MHTINGKIRTIPFQITDFIVEGKKVYHPTYNTGASTFITGEYLPKFKMIEVSNKGRVIDIVNPDNLKTLVVEFVKSVSEHTQAEWVQIPLENNDWEYALESGFVDNNKLIEFEKINDIAFLTISKKEKIISLLKQREEIDAQIIAINPMALVHYELEQLTKK